MQKTITLSSSDNFVSAITLSNGNYLVETGNYSTPAGLTGTIYDSGGNVVSSGINLANQYNVVPVYTSGDTGYVTNDVSPEFTAATNAYASFSNVPDNLSLTRHSNTGAVTGASTQVDTYTASGHFLVASSYFDTMDSAAYFLAAGYDTGIIEVKAVYSSDYATQTITVKEFEMSTAPANTAPVFTGGSTSIAVTHDSGANGLAANLHVNDADTSQTETWTQSGAPSHGTLSFTGATASSGSTDITPGGTITYTPTAGYVGSDSFTVQVSDGTATATRSFTVTVQGPSVSGALPPQTVNDTVTSTTPFTSVAIFDNVTAGESVTVTLTVKGGTALGDLGNLTGWSTSTSGSDKLYTQTFISDFAAQAAVRAATWVPVAHRGTVGTTSAATELDVTVSHGAATATDTLNSVKVFYTNTAPSRTAGGSNSVTSINGAAVTIDPNLTFVDPDYDPTLATATGNWSGGSGAQLVAGISVNADTSHDTLSIAALGGITVSGSNVSYNSTVIGTVVSDGRPGSLLFVALNGNATSTAVSALAEAIQFSSSGTTSTAQRTVTITATDGSAANASVDDLVSVVIGPAVTAIKNAADTSTQTVYAGAVDFTVTFSQAVTGLDASDFALSKTGVTGGTIAGVTTADNLTWTVHVTGLSGTGTVRLDLVAGADYGTGGASPVTASSGGAALTGGAFTSGETYTIVNAPPSISAAGSAVTFVEKGVAAAFSGFGTLGDIDTATLSSATIGISAGAVTGDTLSFANTDGTAFGNIVASWNSTTHTLTLTSAGATATLAQFDAAIKAVTFSTASTDPGSGDRTVDFQVDDGQSANHASNVVSTTVHVTPVNDAPTLAATVGAKTFTEGGAAVALWSGVSGSTIEAGQTFGQIRLTVSGLSDGANEQLTLDGSAVTLTNGTAGTTTGGLGVGYAVSVTGSTATVTLTGALSGAQLTSLLQGATYRDSGNPTAGDRVVTLTSVKDSGGTANGGVDTTTTGLPAAETVTVARLNHAPTLTTTAETPTFVEKGGAVSLFSGTAIGLGTGDGGQTIRQLVLTVSSVSDGAAEQLTIDGTAVALVAGTTTTSGGATVVVTVAGS
ncbi:hypothetical protein EYW49_13330, partial [Siculibacillus lacustris]